MWDFVGDLLFSFLPQRVQLAIIGIMVVIAAIVLAVVFVPRLWGG